MSEAAELLFASMNASIRPFLLRWRIQVSCYLLICYEYALVLGSYGRSHRVLVVGEVKGGISVFVNLMDGFGFIKGKVK